MEVEQDDAEDANAVCVSALMYMHVMNERSTKRMGPIFLWDQYLQGVLAHKGRF